MIMCHILKKNDVKSYYTIIKTILTISFFHYYLVH